MISEKFFYFFPITFFVFSVFFSCSTSSQESGVSELVTLNTPGDSNNSVFVLSSFNNWQLTTPMSYKEGRWEVSLRLKPGEYPYAFYSKTEDKWWRDAENPLVMFEDGVRYSRLIVKDPRYPELVLHSEPEVGESDISLSVKFISGITGSGFDKDSVTILMNGNRIDFKTENEIFFVNQKDLPPGKYSFEFFMKDKKGFASEKVFIPLWIENQPFRWKDAVIYQIMTDRFHNGSADNDAPLDDVSKIANWNGGDFIGITEKIEDGYFSNLGVDVLWISSPVANTQKAWPGMGEDERLYAAYHSYWPVGTGWTHKQPLPEPESVVERNFGTERELKKLMETAHSRGMRIIFDFVPNHVHTDSHLWENYEFSGWFNKAYGELSPNKNGGYTCGWERPLECWFTDYLADIDYRNNDALKRVMEHMLWIIREFRPDGFRIDAVRLMRIHFTETMRHMVRKNIETAGPSFYMIGETFTGETGWDEIGGYLGENRLDGQFDFPLFHQISKTFLSRTQSLSDFVDFFDIHETRYTDNYYKDAVMGNFMGNHDICRALSTANGDFDGTPLGGKSAHERAWYDQPETPDDEKAFLRLRNAHTFIFTTPGIPVVFQGDEFGMPGANDPDNRRMMIFGDKLTEHQKSTLSHVAKLGKFRRKNFALSRGVRKDIVKKENLWGYARIYEDNTVLVFFNISEVAQELTVDISEFFPKAEQLKELFSEGEFNVKNRKINFILDEKTSAVIYSSHN
ncbi:MAG: alpha-amylase family glycosyl hydrolase [bacterium]